MLKNGDVVLQAEKVEEEKINDKPVFFTGFDVERIMRENGAPRAFAKAVAAACRTAGLFDNQCQAEIEVEEQSQLIVDDLKNLINLLNGEK
jgi:hypothetical protein